MKQLFILLLLMLCLEANAQPTPVEVRYLQDYYYLGDPMLVKKDINCFVLTSRKEYKKLFGETNRPDTPDFSKEWMLVLLKKKTKWNAKLSVNKVCMKAGGFIEVYCKIDDGRHTNTYAMYPMGVAIMPKYKEVKRVDFYDEHKMRPLATVAVK